MESPPEPTEPQDIGGATSSLRDAARELTERRSAEESPPDIVSYKKSDKHGRQTDEPSDPKETIDVKRGARDLAAYREAKATAEKQAAEELTRQSVDALRSGQQQPQYSAEQVQAQQNLNNAYVQQWTPVRIAWP